MCCFNDWVIIKSSVKTFFKLTVLYKRNKHPIITMRVVVTIRTIIPTENGFLTILFFTVTITFDDVDFKSIKK